MLSEPLSLAPACKRKWVPGLKNSAPLRNTPLGMTMVPPPAALALSMVFWIASVFSLVLSELAPCWVMTYSLGAAGAFGGAGAWSEKAARQAASGARRSFMGREIG